MAAAADGPVHPVRSLNYAPLVPRPGKIICIGLNYAQHIREMGRELPRYPTLFAKYPEALVGAQDDIVLPAASEMTDWEAELAVVIGAPVRHADAAGAAAAIARYTMLNDVTARDWQYRTPQWLQGKTFEATTPFGPELVTPDELGAGQDAAGPALDLSCTVDGTLMQSANTSDLVFSPAATVAYISSMLTLRPGDVLALGTPGGVGHARQPPATCATARSWSRQSPGWGNAATAASQRRPRDRGADRRGAARGVPGQPGAAGRRHDAAARGRLAGGGAHCPGAAGTRQRGALDAGARSMGPRRRLRRAP